MEKTGDHIDVKCDFYVQALGPINEVDMEFEMEIYFRQRWYDPRMEFSDLFDPFIIPASHVHRIWVPDIFFPNEKSADIHEVTVPNKVIKLFPDGMMSYSARMSLRLACNMLLIRFPHDYQECSIQISSYSYDETSVRLSWSIDSPVDFDIDRLPLPQFELLDVIVQNDTLVIPTGRFSCLKATFSFKRRIGFYVLQTYVPSIMIVSLSWVSFWISTDAVSDRITLGVTTVLTMTTQLGSSRSNTMMVSYMKALDVWSVSCMLFVYSAMLESALVYILSRHEQRRPPTSPPPAQKEPSESEAEMTEMGDATEEDGVTAKGVDKSSRIIFPASFVLFNVVYWIVYTQSAVYNLLSG